MSSVNRIFLITLLSLFHLSSPVYAISCNQIVSKILFSAKYIGEKISELPYYNKNQLAVIKAGAYVLRNIKDSKKSYVPLSRITRYHNLTTLSAKNKLRNRVNSIYTNSETLLEKGYQISEEHLENVAPSATPIRVIELDNGDLIPFDGGGRVLALQMVFKNNIDQIEVEADVLNLDNREIVIQKLLDVIEAHQKVRNSPNVI